MLFRSSYSQDLYLLKTDSTGTLQWSKTYGGPAGETGFDVKQTADSGFILAGNTSSFGVSVSAVYLVRVNQTGTLMWSKTFGGNGFDNGFSVCQTNDEGFIVAGTTNFFGAGTEDAYLIKTDSIGEDRKSTRLNSSH